MGGNQKATIAFGASTQMVHRCGPLRSKVEISLKTYESN